jgi:hypothetical protein
MLFYDRSGIPFLARFRRLLGHRTRALFVGAFLIGGALGGMPIRPEEIEEHMRGMSKAEVVQFLENKHQPSGDPPEKEGQSAAPNAPENTARLYVSWPWIRIPVTTGFFGWISEFGFAAVDHALRKCVRPALVDCGEISVSGINRSTGRDWRPCWLKHAAEPIRIAPKALLIIKSFAFILVLALVGGQVGGPVLSMYLVFISVLVLIIFRELRRRS